MFYIGKNKIENIACLAPMAGFTDSAFRQVCRRMGAAFTVSEMISAKALCYQDKKTSELLKFTDLERPFGFQLFGNEVESMTKAAQILEELCPDFIDVNMGCPVPKIAGNGCGSALLKDGKKAGEIISNLVRHTKLPITAKIRIGLNRENLNGVEIAKILEDNGVCMIAVHGRTRADMYLPGVNAEYIGKVKAAVKVPVIANGDVNSRESMKKMLDASGADGVMIGRGALGNPFIFKELCQDSFSEPSFKERTDNIKELAKLECEIKGEKLAMLELRRHLPLFFKGIRGAAEIRRRSTSICTYGELLDLISDTEKIMEETA